jgi:hypothetical protein
MGIVAAAADKHVKRLPVGAAKLLEGGVGFSRNTLTGGEDNRPLGACKLARAPAFQTLADFHHKITGIVASYARTGFQIKVQNGR